MGADAGQIGAGFFESGLGGMERRADQVGQQRGCGDGWVVAG